MNKTQFTILAALLVVLIALVGFSMFRGGERSVTANQSSDSVEATGVRDVCPICGRDRVQAHGRILIKNLTTHQVTVYARHHPKAPEKEIVLDPQGFEVVPDVLVGTMRLRAVGDGFDEESFCTILANTQHEMWWTTRGWEMHGTPQTHIGD